jgi:hypothetical protein
MRDWSDRYCALGDSRSWTDLVTNVTELSAARVEHDFDALMGWGSVPQDLLPGFLHELTHHWCFLSPVGFVLATLQLRARRSGVLLYNDAGDGTTLRRRLVDDVQRYETASIMLRPLAEGLALFTEFDAVSGDRSSVVSLPTQLTGTFFGVQDLIDPSTKIGFLPAIHRAPLARMRQGYHCFRRKRALIQEPLDLATGGYLPGYLAIRDVWLYLAEQDPRLLNETDLTLMYVRSFFYEDYALLRLLLSPAQGLNTHFEIVEYLAKRFDQLAHVRAEDIAAYEGAILMREHGASVEDRSAALSHAILVDPGVFQAASTLVDEMIAELEDRELESVDEVLRIWDAELLGNRDIMYLGSLACLVDVGADGTCTVRVGDASITLPSAQGTQSGTTDGRVDVFFSTLTELKARAAVVYRGSERVAVSFGGPDALTREARARFETLRISRDSLQSGTSEMRDNMQAVIDRDPELRRDVHEIEALATEAATAIYQNMATLHVAPHRKRQAIEMLSRDGMLEVLAWDDDLIDGLTYLSLGWPLRLRRDQIARLLDEKGISLGELLNRLDECSRRFGRRLVLNEDDLLFTAV